MAIIPWLLIRKRDSVVTIAAEGKQLDVDFSRAESRIFTEGHGNYFYGFKCRPSPSVAGTKLADDESGIINSGSRLDAREEFRSGKLRLSETYIPVYFRDISGISVMLRAITARGGRKENEHNVKAELRGHGGWEREGKITKDFA